MECMKMFTHKFMLKCMLAKIDSVVKCDAMFLYVIVKSFKSQK